jgi:hypothetical protein
VQDRPQPRRQLHGYVSTEARDGWYAFAAAHGTNVTALLDACGELLGREAAKSIRELSPLLRQLVSEAQLIASSRSSRRRNE